MTKATLSAPPRGWTPFHLPDGPSINRTVLAALPLIAALALTACSTNPAETASPSTSAPVTSSSAAPANSASPISLESFNTPLAEASEGPQDSNAWTKQIRDQFMDSYDRTDVSQFSDGTPHQKIDGWYQIGSGQLLVEPKGNDWRIARLSWLAMEVIGTADPEGQRLNAVTVSSEDHEISRTYHHGDRRH